MEKVLDGKVAIVTGSGQGVGRGIALYMASQGAKVITNNRKPKGEKISKEELSFKSIGVNGETELNEEEMAKYLELRGDAESTAMEIKREGGIAIPFYGDVSDYNTASEMVQAAIDNFGRIDIIVNNAAGLGFGPFVKTSQSDWDYQIQAKLNGAFNLMTHAIPYMIKQGYGRILNSASDAWIGISNLSAYSAANAGIVALSKATAKELDRFGITVNSYCPQAKSPGHVGFNMTLRTMMDESGIKMDFDNEQVKESEKEHGDARNLGPFLSYLCMEESQYINGAVFTVTGGGRVSLYSEPEVASSIKKENQLWSMEELKTSVPEVLLKNYKSIVANKEF